MRERHGLRQVDLAYRAGTSQQALSRVEQGLVSPTVEMLARLAACCGEELVLDARERGVPFEDAQLEEQARLAIGERLELALSWNRPVSKLEPAVACSLMPAGLLASLAALAAVLDLQAQPNNECGDNLVDCTWNRQVTTRSTRAG